MGAPAIFRPSRAQNLRSFVTRRRYHTPMSTAKALTGPHIAEANNLIIIADVGGVWQGERIASVPAAIGSGLLPIRICHHDERLSAKGGTNWRAFKCTVRALSFIRARFARAAPTFHRGWALAPDNSPTEANARTDLWSTYLARINSCPDNKALSAPLVNFLIHASRRSHCSCLFAIPL